VFRVALLGQGGPCGAARPHALCPGRARAGRAADAGPRATARVRQAGSTGAVFQDERMPSPGGQVSEMAGTARTSRPCAASRHLADLPKDLSHRVKGATSRGKFGRRQGAPLDLPLTRSDRATPGRRDAEEAPHLRVRANSGSPAARVFPDAVYKRLCAAQRAAGRLVGDGNPSGLAMPMRQIQIYVHSTYSRPLSTI
jgi:hypothetical protein